MPRTRFAHSIYYGCDVKEAQGSSKKTLLNCWYSQVPATFHFRDGSLQQVADLDTRISTLNDFFTYLLYCNVARSLFQKDKLLLSFSICITNLRGQGKFDIEEWNFLLSGAVSTEKTTKANPSAWLSDKLWNEMVQLSKLASFVVRKISHYHFLL